MTKHRGTRSRTRQKGGFWPFTSSDPYASTQSWGDYFSGLGNKANSAIGNMTTGITEGATNMYNSTDVTTTTNDLNTVPSTVSGGKRNKTRNRRMKGGKGDMGLTYYATPVSGLSVAKPTYWLKGGSKKHKCKRKRCKTRRCKKH